MKRYALLWTLLVTALLAGCAMNPDDGLSDEDRAVLRYDSASLDGAFELLEVNRATSGDIVRAQVHLRNKSSFSVDYQYKFRWYDRNGFEIAPEGEPWRPQRASGKAEVRLQAVAPNAAVARFELWLREE
ncbi:hypothetical protein S7S_00895 [Isoalcanivorax pacificus W11-5]|uniref:Lipoprotein n=1 Tax=Isoalcanivorax pacificus W11-5 TaxID=391936 RepID=A0A0B4XJ62_9GAMM|nr:YcfL family protein [Isoalcanivorax pacificus]AJD46603.1 hypothetical protein S7S_00895 [Isoalcanivorax pacificus W11-5]